MTNWNFADVWEVVASIVPEAPALIHGEKRVSWSEMERRANGIAKMLVDEGATKQGKVAHYLYNCPEYLESTFGILKAALVPINTNYRYSDDELVYLWDNADTEAIIFHGTFTERVQALRPKVNGVRTWIWVDDGTSGCPDWAIPYEQAASSSTERVVPRWGRSGDDLYMLYTGGTTGMPKGVMWRQDDLFARLNMGNFIRVPEEGGLKGVGDTIVGPGPLIVPACPLMHGTGAFTSMGTLGVGGCVVTLTNRRFDAVELLDTIDAENVNVVALVGDAFAKPILGALDANRGRWKLSTLIAIISSGVMFSEETKRGLLAHHGSMMIIDAFSSSEALGMGTSVSSGGEAERTARFTLGPDVKVIDPESGKDIAPGSGEMGVLALGGRNPIGYYKDRTKTDNTFKEIDGVRYSIPGDFAVVDSDGSIHLMGRGSVCINTGGEKVFPEEVEEAIKLHPAVADAVAVGIPDERFGEVVTAVVELHPGHRASAQEIIDQVKGRLAGYKAPKMVRFVKSVERSPAGKVDYGRHRSDMAEWVTSAS